MQNPKRILIGLLLACLAVGTAVANPLYSGEVLVTDEGSDARNAALSALLGDVLVKVSGNTAVAGQPAASELLASAPALVEQYRYRTAEHEGEMRRYLWARFDQPVVERMMRERNIPVWTQRPRVLLWLATERAGQRSLLNLDNQPDARAALLGRAQSRGMPLQLPLMDLEDQGRLSPADVWSDYEAAIRSASARYPYDLILTGRLRAQRDGKWSGLWSLLDRNGGQTFQTGAQPLPEALALAVDQAQDLLAARFAPTPTGGDGDAALVQFAGVYDLAAYGRLVALLDGTEAVARAALRQVQGETFLFDLQLRSPPAALVQSLELSGLVAAEPAPPRVIVPPPTGGIAEPVSGPVADLYFRLLN